MERSIHEVAEMENKEAVTDGNSENFKWKKGGIITMPFIFGKLASAQC